MQKDKHTALITGASSGIGRALAYHCARRGMDLALVALPGEGLPDIAADLCKKYPIRAEVLELDLSASDAPIKAYRWCREERLPISVLINNAGMGNGGCFEDTEPDFYGKLLRVNTQATVLLTRYFLPEIMKHPQGYIMNMASVASFHPVPYKSVYAASKTFVLTFSRALREELKDRNVYVSVVCPGPVATNGEVLERIKKQGALGRMMMLSASQVADISLSKMLAGKQVIVPGGWTRFWLGVTKCMPPALRATLAIRLLKPEKKQQAVMAEKMPV